ncbi:DUF397 domain-containing protein [Streptomyces sioyaensis]
MNSEWAWFKSSYSGGDGEACIEVAVAWRKSIYIRAGRTGSRLTGYRWGGTRFRPTARR